MKQTKTKLRTDKRICYLNELTEQDKQRCNQICNLGFSKENRLFEANYISSIQQKNPIVSLLYVGDLIVGVCFVDIERKDVIKPLSNLFLHLHTICIDPEYRGNGLCFHLVRNLLNAKINIDDKMYSLGRSLNMYLHVRTSKGDHNVAAIKCYQKNGFELVDMMYEVRRDGEVTTAMVRKKGHTKRSSSKKTKKK